ncbi:aromatic amino acid lyase [Morganella morganii]|uniref:aromatic amino acid lyase n=1 Tax=Morganella morganii TaxID=582 RepID=UPI003C12C57F
MATEETVHAFGAIEKDMMALALHNKNLAMPLSLEYLPVAGGIEDIATRAPAVTQYLQQQIDNCYELLSILLIHSAQAVDLRRQQNPHFRLAQHTASLYDVVRASAAFMQSDKAIRPDVQTLAGILRDHHNDIIRSLYAIHQYPHHQRRCDRRTKAKTD